MKTIKIFIASSEELGEDRIVFGNLVRRLDAVYEKRGIRLRLFEWEDYDAAYNNRRKQEEYNDQVRDSDVFLALFYKKAGQYTIEEFDIATETFKGKGSPKVYTYMRSLQPGEQVSPELAEFKKRLLEELGHYWCSYDNRDSLQLQFVMQLQLVESNLSDSVNINDGKVNVEGVCVASMDNLRFAAENEEYSKMSAELVSLPKEVEKARSRMNKYPDDEDLSEEYQTKLDRLNNLQKDFEDYQKKLFETAKRISRLQGGRVTDRMRRAIDAFNRGKIHESNIILNEAEADAQRNLDEYKRSKELADQKRQAVICSIEELLLKTSTMMADTKVPIKERIDLTDSLYSQAVKLAQEIEYDEEDYAQILFSYGRFLSDYARFEKALKCLFASEELIENIYGVYHNTVLACYSRIGLILKKCGYYDDAMDYYKKALFCSEIVNGPDSPETAILFDNLGLLSLEFDDYQFALECCKDALDRFTKVYGLNHFDTATAMNNVGLVYSYLNDYDKALEYYKKALKVCENIYGTNHSSMGTTYDNMGGIYASMGDYSLALEYALKAIDIYEETLGRYHYDTEIAYGNAGHACCELGNISQAIPFFEKALEIQERIFGDDHQETLKMCDKLADLYEEMGELEKALVLRERVAASEDEDETE